jgi:formylglycine-generating enzyme required for sulfatase activity
MRRLNAALLAALLAGCATPPTAVPVTLTAPVPTATVAPLNLIPAMEVGASMRYTDGSTLLGVPSGPFKMGRGKAENPEHTVTLSDYWIYATKVTNAQYALCVEQERCAPPDEADNLEYAAFEGRNDPVVGVTYEQAQDYCNYMNASLPTEAQWEKAARGPEANLYPWGAADPTCELLNFNNCVKQTTDVTKYPKGKSYYGALDMEGNTYEWVADWYDPLYYETSAVGDPPGPLDGKARVQRGSSYRSNAGQAVTYARSFASPRNHARDLGFRCAVSDAAYFASACQLAPSVSAEQLSALSVKCPKISIDVQVSACRYGGGAIVTFDDEQPNDPNASFGGIVGCSLVSGVPGTYPLTYACKTSSTAVLSTSCTYSGIQGASCPQHYRLEPVSGLCKWEGKRTLSTECPTGEFFDPIHYCCVVTTGHIVDFPVCPVGSVFTEAGPEQFFCLPAGSALSAPVVQANVNPPDCPGACNLLATTCAERNLVFCETTCSCLPVGSKCPTH